ncbi:hypothetical protein TNCV_4025021 [Trichonephila clavipes]|uniref:Uncharacterized protein n=1 Tax=Trichonephila clavipes TaxID=2585209 RepID=A0A8X6WDG4_TRICX|nr:hypothetical protein TNCV_4025021 [Trichonephila clavipes]
MQRKRRAIDSQTGIGRRIGGIPKLTTNILTIVDRRGSATNLKVKVLGIIGGSIDAAEVVNVIIDSIIKVVDRGFKERCFKGSEWSKQVFRLLSFRCKSGGYRSQNIANPPNTERRTIRISSLGMAPVDLPYVPILLNETFVKTPLGLTLHTKINLRQRIPKSHFV